MNFFSLWQSTRKITRSSIALVSFRSVPITTKTWPLWGDKVCTIMYHRWHLIIIAPFPPFGQAEKYHEHLIIAKSWIPTNLANVTETRERRQGRRERKNGSIKDIRPRMEKALDLYFPLCTLYTVQFPLLTFFLSKCQLAPFIVKSSHTNMDKHKHTFSNVE